MSSQPVTAEEVSFTCPRCGRTSFNPNDARERYCGNCHDWTGLPAEARGRTGGFYGLTLTPLDYGGFRVKETPTHWIDVIPMIYNWRIVRTPKASPLTYDRGWCYQGTGPQEFAAAVLAAQAWDGGDDTEPAGYFKRAGA